MLPKLKLQHQITLTMLLVGVLPAIIITSAAVWFGEKTLRKQIKQELQYTVVEKANDISNVLQEYLRETKELATYPLLIEAAKQANLRYAANYNMVMQKVQQADREWIDRQGNTALAQQLMANDLSVFLSKYQSKSNSRYGEIFVTDVHGATIGMTRTLSDYYQADEQWWNDSYSSGHGKVFMDDHGFDESVGSIVIGIVVPVRDHGQVIGILKINYKMNGIVNLAIPHKTGSADHALIMRDDGTVLLSTYNGPHPNMHEVSGLKEDDTPYSLNGQRFLESRALVKTPLPIMSRIINPENGKSGQWQQHNWYTTLHIDVDHVFAAVKHLRNLSGIVLLLVLAVVTYTGLRLGKLLSAPLQNLRNGISMIMRGDLNYRLQTEVSGEVGDVARGFEAMTQHLQKVMTSRDDLLHEVSLRNEAEEKLRESEQGFRGAFEQAAVGIAHVGLDGSWLRVNQRLCQIIGYSETELLQKSFQDITYPDDLDRNMAELQKLLEGKAETYTMEKRCIRKDGSLVWINLTVALAHKPDGDPDYFISVIEDIDEKKKMRDELELLNKQLEKRVAARTTELTVSNEQLERTLKKLYEAEEQMLQAEKMAAMGTFTAGIAHEVNNPLTGVLNYVQYARDRIDDVKLKGYLDKAEHNTLRAAKVIQNMLAYSRRAEITEQETDIHRLIEQSVEVMRPELNMEHIAIELEVQDTLPPVMANPDTLQQVLINLMGNARDALENQTNKRIALRAVEQDDIIRISITDNGQGIADEIGKQIFDPFFTTKEIGKGTGLGLSLCQRIITNLGGSISYVSEVGKGTTFNIYIPVQQFNSKGVSQDAQHTGY